ncbi:DUF4430 domain-containing protein [Candidatus Collinsella stercoripullorum]|uniref:DUF4430 domain-containing protein n=1 Tax=Candidatus Collinsella stercoripullorum TaxID=2838522 RepID=UPI0022DFED05|nr:DUF4430 domain-containing protein [Candidatus Collinsella stercoripullorum]
MAADDTRKLDPVENGGAAPDAAHGDLDRTQQAPARPAGEASTPESFVTFGEGAQGDPGKAAAPRRATGRPVLLGALALCCVVLIVASLGFVHPSDDGSWSLSWLFQTTEAAEEPASAGSGSADASGAPAGADGASDAADGSADASSADAFGQDAGASADSSVSSSDTGAASSSGGSSSSSSSSSGGGSSSSSGGSQGSSGGSQTPSDDRRDTVTVTVTISSDVVGGSVSGGGTFTFEKGATAYDALCACGLSVNASDSAYGIYVSAIGGLAAEGTQGWNYAVNGVTPGMSSSYYELSDGDTVDWFYVLS